MHLELSSVPKDNISDIHFMHKQYLTTLIFGFFLWQLNMADYFNKNFTDYEAGFSSQGDF